MNRVSMLKAPVSESNAAMHSPAIQACILLRRQAQLTRIGGPITTAD